MNTNTVQLADSDIQWCTVYIHSKSPSKKKKTFFCQSCFASHSHSGDERKQFTTHYTYWFITLTFPSFWCCSKANMSSLAHWTLSGLGENSSCTAWTCPGWITCLPSQKQSRTHNISDTCRRIPEHLNNSSSRQLDHQLVHT